MIKVKRLHKDARLPTKGYRDDACYDIYSVEDKFIPSRSTVTVRTGIAIEPPEGYFVRLYTRSSMAKKGLIVGAGIIDPGYRGEIIVVIHNVSDVEREIKKGDKIAQFTLHKVYDFDIVEVDNLTETDRGDKGFGSTGRWLR